MNKSTILATIAATTDFTEYSDEQLAFYRELCKGMNPLLLSQILRMAHLAGQKQALQRSEAKILAMQNWISASIDLAIDLEPIEKEVQS